MAARRPTNRDMYKYLPVLTLLCTCAYAHAQPQTSPPQVLTYSTEISTYGVDILVLSLEYQAGTQNIVAKFISYTPIPISSKFGQCRGMRVLADGFNFPVSVRYSSSEIPNYIREVMTFYIPPQTATYASSVDTVNIFLCGCRFGLERRVLDQVAAFGEAASRLE